MKITRIELANFKPHQFPNIHHLVIEPQADIQILMGTNGSSKSTTLREMSPFAPTKTMYNKNGYKRLDIEHNGSTYTLISDFKNKNKVHSFIKDNEELNQGGTQPVQNELVERYLKYTPLVQDILYNNCQICSMLKSERKTLLLNINPIDLSLVVEKHKYVSSKIREFKNNLSLLYRRKQEIESEMLSREVLSEKISKRDKYKEELHNLSVDEYYINKQLEYLNNMRTSFDTRVLDILKYSKDVKKDLKEFFDLDKLEKDINILSYKYPDIDREDTNKQQELTIYLSNKEQEENHFKSGIAEQLSRIDNANKHLQDIQASNDANILEKLLKELEEEYKDYKDDVEPKVVIPEEEYPTYHNLQSDLTSVITKYVNSAMSRKVLSQELIQKCTSKYTEIQYTYLNEYKYKISRLDKLIEEIDKELSTLPCDPKELTTQCNLCDYRRVYIDRRVHLEDRRHTYLKDRETYEKLYSSYLTGLDTLEKFIQEKKELYKYVRTIYDILEPSNFKISESSIISRLNEDPIKFNNTIVNIVSSYPRIYKKKKLEKEIAKIRSDIQVMEKTNLPSLEFIKELIHSCESSIATINKDLVRTQSDIDHTKYELSGYDTYNKLKNKCLMISDLIHKTYDYVYIEATKYFYTDKLNTLLDKKNSLIYDYNTLEKEIKEQELLLARYEKETITLIEDIEKKKKLYEKIEFGISPSTGFPYKNMIEYLNVLINNVNCILDAVWSYPLQLVPLTLKDTLDYTFKCIVDDIEISDISKLSRGQQTIVNLAFTISFIINMNLTNYPIFFDEVIEGLDMTHTQKALEWLKSIVDDKYVSQMFFVNHDAVLNSGFEGSDVICLMDTNISVPNHANEHVTIE